MGDDGRDSGLRGRVTRRQNAPQDHSAAAVHHDDDDHDDEGAGSWKQEMESIMAGVVTAGTSALRLPLVSKMVQAADPSARAQARTRRLSRASPSTTKS